MVVVYDDRPGKETRAPCNADDVASSASLGAIRHLLGCLCPLACPSVPALLGPGLPIRADDTFFFGGGGGGGARKILQKSIRVLGEA